MLNLTIVAWLICLTLAVVGLFLLALITHWKPNRASKYDLRPAFDPSVCGNYYYVKRFVPDNSTWCHTPDGRYFKVLSICTDTHEWRQLVVCTPAEYPDAPPVAFDATLFYSGVLVRVNPDTPVKGM